MFEFSFTCCHPSSVDFYRGQSTWAGHNASHADQLAHVPGSAAVVHFFLKPARSKPSTFHLVNFLLLHIAKLKPCTDNFLPLCRKRMAAANQNAAAPTDTNSATTATRCPSLRQRLAQASNMAWTVINVFSPAIPNILHRLLTLWFISTYIVLAFVCTVMVRTICAWVGWGRVEGAKLEGSRFKTHSHLTNPL